MTPKEKANELVEKYLSLNDNFNKPIITDEQDAVKCAIVAVNEMINDLKQSFELSKELHPHANGLIAGSLVYWQSVKTELEKI